MGTAPARRMQKSLGMKTTQYLKLTNIILLTAAALLILASCGGRSLPGADGLVSDGGMVPDKGKKKDACVSPKSCSSNKDCKPGFKCSGCSQDPCCPNCFSCFRKCIPDNGCASAKDCAGDEYCELGPGCGKGAPGACIKRPGSCPKYLQPPPAVCGCDGKTYGGGCEAHKNGVSVDYEGVCKTAGCAANVDCKAGQFCYIANGCKVTGAKMGDCKARPNICNSLYSPVCGCDNKTYGNICEAHTKGINAAHKGTCKTSCEDLIKQYAAELQKAKKCSGGPSSIPECTMQVYSYVGCGCPTYANPANVAAIQALKSIKSQWATKSSSTVIPCPPVSCKKITKGVCGFGATSFCMDQ